MAERREPEELLEPVEAGPAMLEPSTAAVALALSKRRGGPRTDARLDEFLEKQSRMLDLQMEHLHEQRALQVRHLEHQEKHLKLRYFGDRLRIGLQLLGILFGVAIAAGLAVMVWRAHQDRGAVIEAFAAPPDLAARGLSGEVIANLLLDRLRELEADTVTGRPAATYANDWGGDIKVEIPETGVSIGELNRYLRQWLGSATTISGEVWRTPTGLALTTRAGDAPGKTFQGSEAELNALIQQGAEAVYAGTQPYRYAAYLQTHGHPEQAAATFARLAATGDPEERAWANAGWSTVLLNQGDLVGGAVHAREALPRVTSAYGNLTQANGALSHDEEMLAAARFTSRAAAAGRTNPNLPQGADRLSTGGAIAFLLGDYKAAAAGFGAFGDMVSGAVRLEGRAAAIRIRPRQVEALAQGHDVSAARRLLAATDVPAADFTLVSNSQTAQVAIDVEVEDWSAAAAHLESLVAFIQGLGPVSRQAVHRRDWSHLAVVYARLGRLADADRMIALTPLDCDDCLRARGQIAAFHRDRAGADRWFAAAARHAPSIPFAYADWGRALLAMGDVDAAIDKLKEARSRGPHFADPLELWGEALMRKGDYAGAIRKFVEADKDAPRWGRNHLRWGEALLLLGRYREARAQFEAASGMDLSRPDRAALDVFLARTAAGPLHS